jgi:hypothetical protein
MVARMIFCRSPKRSTMASTTVSGRRGMLRQQPVAAGLTLGVEVERVAGQVQHLGHDLEVEQVLGAEVGERVHGLVEVPAGSSWK